MEAVAYERELIGAIMKRPNILDHVMKEIEPRDFEDYLSHTLYGIIVNLYTQGSDVKYGEVFAKARIDGLVNDRGDEIDIRNVLTDNIGHPSMHSFYTQKIKSAALRRRMLMVADQLADMAIQTELTDADCMERMNTLLSDVNTKPKTRIKGIEDIYTEYIDTMDRQTAIKSPKTGVSDIDARIQGIGCNRLITVAGRPGGGKTTFVVQTLHNIGLQNVGPTILFTMEMDQEEIIEKMIADHFSINYSDVQSRKFTTDQRNSLLTSDRVKKSNMFIDDTPFIDADHVMQVCREYKRKHGQLGAIGIDYLGLMNKHKAKGENTTEAIGRITQAFKQLARELQCSIFMLAQMNRENERLKDALPVMADLRDSGNIEQDSDMVLFLHRKPESEQDDPRYTKIQLVIAKGRKTGTGVIDLCFSGALQRISSANVRHTS